MNELMAFVIGVFIGAAVCMFVTYDATGKEYFSGERLNICAKNNISVKKCLEGGMDIP